MDWLVSLNESLQYIENNLDKELDINRAAQIACCSSYHYQRMFSYMAGVPLSEYIRRRRMTRAAFDMQNSDTKIIDIALKYGYECVLLGLINVNKNIKSTWQAMGVRLPLLAGDFPQAPSNALYASVKPPVGVCCYSFFQRQVFRI